MWGRQQGGFGSLGTSRTGDRRKVILRHLSHRPHEYPGGQSKSFGVGARQSQLIDGSMEDETILRAGLSYRWKLAENTELRQNFVLESGAENTYRESATSLSARLLGNFALVASYTSKNNSVVPPLTEKTDTYTAVSLEYTF